MPRSETLFQSSSFKHISKPLKTSLSSSKSYVLALASADGYYAASASTPSNVIDIFDKSTFKGIQTLPGHERATTSLQAADNIPGIARKCIISSGKDGSVKVWDERSGQHSIKMTNLGKTCSLLCCAISPDGRTFAAGTDLQGDDALILYWDPRQPATPLRIHSSTHSDDITTLAFSPSSTSENTVLLSGSLDGLLSLSNAKEDVEDEALLHVGNWGSSISQAGWIVPEGEKARIWAASDMETFSVWSEELDKLRSVDIRDPGINTDHDYLITCHNVHTSGYSPGVFLGSNEGNFALLSNTNLSESGAPWNLNKRWTNGHDGIVRSLLWDEELNLIVTGGEDSKLNVWPFSIPDDFATGDMDVDVTSPKRKRELDGVTTEKDERRSKKNLATSDRQQLA